MSYAKLNKIINLREQEEYDECIKEIASYSTILGMKIPEWIKDFNDFSEDEKNKKISNWLIEANNRAVAINM